MRTGDFTPLILRCKQLDRSITEAMLLAEKACYKAKHVYDWSLKLVCVGKTARYWKTRKSSLHNNTDFSHMFHLAKPLEIDDDPSLILSDVNKKLSAARKELKAVHQNAAATRNTYLEEMAKKRIKDRKGDLAAVIQNVKHCEEMKHAFQQMKPITKGMTGSVVSKLIVPNLKALTSPAT
eukprot:4797513-Ditylum_brightwellii.AAC.1